MPNNKHFINVNNTMIIGKSDINGDKYDSLNAFLCFILKSNLIQNYKESKEKLFQAQ